MTYWSVGDVDLRTKHLGTWVKKCYIFTYNRSVGKEKIKEIAEEKAKKYIQCTKYIEKCGEIIADFTDGETWYVTRPDCTFLGKRWDKCYVDASNVHIMDLERIIKPAAMGEDAEIMYFN